MPFVKGVCANPRGRATKGYTLVDLIEKYANKMDPTSEPRHKYRDSIAKILVEKAAAGDIKFITEYFDRTIGKPRQAVEHGGGVDLNFTIDWGTGDAAGNEPEIPATDGEPETV